MAILKDLLVRGVSRFLNTIYCKDIISSDNITATKFIGDLTGNSSNAIQNIALDGNTLNYTKGDNSTGSITLPSADYAKHTKMITSGKTITIVTKGQDTRYGRSLLEPIFNFRYNNSYGAVLSNSIILGMNTSDYTATATFSDNSTVLTMTGGTTISITSVIGNTEGSGGTPLLSKNTTIVITLSASIVTNFPFLIEYTPAFTEITSA